MSDNEYVDNFVYIIVNIIVNINVYHNEYNCKYCTKETWCRTPRDTMSMKPTYKASRHAERVIQIYHIELKSCCCVLHIPPSLI